MSLGRLPAVRAAAGIFVALFVAAFVTGCGPLVAPRGGPGFFGGCPAIGLLRAIRITLSSPVAPALISFSSAA